MHPFDKAPETAGSVDRPNKIQVEISDDTHTIKALEVVCFERKFDYRRLPSGLLKKPTPGKVLYEIWHTDPIQLFWLGAAFQSLLTQ